MSETRELVAILVADVVGYSRFAGADEERTLARLRGLRNDLIDPAIATNHGRIVKRTRTAASSNSAAFAGWAATSHQPPSTTMEVSMSKHSKERGAAKSGAAATRATSAKPRCGAACQRYGSQNGAANRARISNRFLLGNRNLGLPDRGGVERRRQGPFS
jgi:adenylate cyclase